MCGLAGFLNTNNQIEQSSDTVLRMLALQKHRGPDDSGILGIQMQEALLQEREVSSPQNFSIKPNLIFGFNRLSILDLSPNGNQPMIHEESKVALMMNGEVYNAFDFKPELEKLGFVFKGSSDTEVVLYLYLAYGLQGMLERLNGMFALAIYDGRSKKMFLIRDRMGIKPLYVLKQNHRLAFASEMKSFKALPDFRFELDESQISEFLLFRNSINKTLFKHITNITPGTFWRISASGEVNINTYYDLRNEGARNNVANKEQLATALKTSVKRQMISDVKLGCQLSGGVDSSMVTAYAAHTLPEGALETVSIVFNQAHFSEKKYIDQVVKQLQLQSHQFTLNAQAYLDLIDEAVWHFEQPLNHPNSCGIKLLSREAKKHVTVLLSGEGADECLAGYSRFIPQKNKVLTLETLKKLIKNKSKWGAYIKLVLDPDKRYLLQTAYGGVASSAILYPSFSASKALQSRLEIWNSIHDSLLKRKRKYELLSYLPDLLMRQDKMSMAHSIENRVPFLDNQMVETSLAISDDLLIKQNKGRWEGKWLLKEICSDTFGEDFAYRDKMGFSIPLKSFFNSEAFQNRWENEILPGIKNRGIFEYRTLVNWMKISEKLNAEQLDAVWLMLGFEIWAKQYLD